jgi:hypothetical protein
MRDARKNRPLAYSDLDNAMDMELTSSDPRIEACIEKGHRDHAGRLTLVSKVDASPGKLDFRGWPSLDRLLKTTTAA